MQKERSKYLTFPLLAVLPVYMVLYSWLYVFYSAYGQTFNPLWMNAVLFFVPLLEVLFWNMAKQRNTFGHRLGELVLLPVIAFILYSLFLKGTYAQKFEFRINFVFAVIVLVTWIITFVNHSCFFYAEKYDEDSEKHYDYGRFAHYGVQRYLGFIKLQMLACWAAFMFGWFNEGKPGMFGLVFAGAASCAFLVLIHQARTFKDIFEYAEDDIEYSDSGKRQNAMSSAVIIFLALFIGFLTAKGKVILPLKRIIMAIMAFFAPKKLDLSNMRYEHPPMGEISDMEELRQELPNTIAADFVMQVIMYVLIAMILGLVVYMFFQLILFVRFRRVKEKNMRWKDILKKGLVFFLKSLGEFILDFFRFIFRNRKNLNFQLKFSEDIKIKRPAVRNRSEKKEKEIDEVLYMYIKLVRWGVKCKVPWFGQMPLEYNAELGLAFPEHTDTFNLIVDIYEESMYSDHLLEPARLHSYKAAIRKIVKRRMKTAPLLDQGM